MGSLADVFGMFGTAIEHMHRGECHDIFPPITNRGDIKVMMEQLAVWFGRNVTVRGSARLLSRLYPCKYGTSRYIRGRYARADGLIMDLDSRNWIDWNLLGSSTVSVEARQVGGSLIQIINFATL